MGLKLVLSLWKATIASTFWVLCCKLLGILSGHLNESSPAAAAFLLPCTSLFSKPLVSFIYQVPGFPVCFIIITLRFHFLCTAVLFLYLTLRIVFPEPSEPELPPPPLEASLLADLHLIILSISTLFP